MGQVIETQILTTHIIETDESGRLVIPAEMLGDTKPHEKYAVEKSETGIVLHLLESGQSPVETATETPTFEEWQEGWKELQVLMGQSWKTNKSAAEIISEMRR